MIRIYDIGRDEKTKCPSLIEVKTIMSNVDVSDRIKLVWFMNKELSLCRFDTEHVYLITADLYNRILGVFLIGIGDYKGCNLYNRNIATAILLSGGRKFLLIHNHPDGALELSEDDIMTFNVMKAISKLLETEFLNSYVITEDGFITDDMDSPIYYDEMEE